MNVEELPEYQTAKNEYVAAVSLADRNGDQVAKLQAELGWERQQRSLSEQVRTINEQHTRLTSAVEQVKRDFPMAPASLIESIKDPDTLLRVAKEMHDKVVEAQGGTWGAPAGAPGQPAERPKGGKKSLGLPPKEYNDLVDRVNSGDKNAARIWKSLFYKQNVAGWSDAARAGKLVDRP